MSEENGGVRPNYPIRQTPQIEGFNSEN